MISKKVVRSVLVVLAVCGLSLSVVAQPSGGPGNQTPGQGQGPGDGQGPGQRPGDGQGPGQGQEEFQEFLGEITELVVNETPVETPIVEDGQLFKFTTNRAGMYRVKTTAYPETPVDTVLVLARPIEEESENGDIEVFPEFIGGNDDLRFDVLTSELNRHLDAETEYIVVLRPYAEFDEDGVSIIEPIYIGAPVLIQVEGPIHDDVYPTGNVLARYGFSGESIDEDGWQHLPGGFAGGSGGDAFITDWPAGAFVNSVDGRGAALTIASGEISVLLGEPVLSSGQPILVRVGYQSLGAGPQFFLAALNGNALTGEGLDGSLVLNQVADISHAVEGPRVLNLIYRRPRGTYITPLIQVVGGGDETTVGIDRIVVYELDSNGIY